MPKCQFATKYYDYETHNEFDFYCDDEEALSSGFYIFHDKDYLQDKTDYEEYKRQVLDRLKHKLDHAISNNEPLLCIASKTYLVILRVIITLSGRKIVLQTVQLNQC